MCGVKAGSSTKPPISEPFRTVPSDARFLQYFYSLTILTPLQHAPAVLSQLLLLSASYGLDELGRLVRHAMHRALAPTTSVGVYEVATLCGCQSLQIRFVTRFTFNDNQY